jgi:hypothetical protein
MRFRGLFMPFLSTRSRAAQARSEDRGERSKKRSEEKSMKEEGRTSFLSFYISQRLEASALKLPTAA